MATQQELDNDTAKYIAIEEKRLGRVLTDWEKHKISDQVYFMSLPPGAVGPPGTSGENHA